MEGQDAEEFDAVAGAALDEKVFGEPSFIGINSLHLADLFDQESQGYVNHGVVQSGAADAGRQRHVADFAQKAAGERAQGTDGALGKREHVGVGAQRGH
jgi:hypothetical protein